MSARRAATGGQQSATFRTAIAIVTLVGLLLTGLHFAMLRRQSIEDVAALTRMAGTNAAAAVVFDDRAAATETLATLGVLPDLESAAIYGADGALFASYLREGRVSAWAREAGATAPGSRIDMRRLTVVDTIVVDGTTVGTVQVRLGLRTLYTRLVTFVALFLIAGLVALSISYPLVRRMRLQVAQAADRIRAQASLLDKARDAIVVRDLGGKVEYWNQGAQRLYGWTADEAIELPAGAAASEAGPGPAGAVAAAVAHGEWRGELVRRRRDGEPVTAEGHWTLLRDDAGAPRAILAIETDITARKRAEARVTRLSRLRAVHGGISSAILRVHEHDELLYAACRVAVTDGVFASAWAMAFRGGAQSAQLAAWFGERPEFLVGLNITVDPHDPGADSPVNRAARLRALVICNDVAAEPARDPLRAALLAQGQHALAACPLVVDGRTQAVLVLTARETGFFDEEEVALVEWLRADLSYALDHLDKAKRLDYLAYYDALTGLPNSTLFRDRLGQFLHATGPGGGVAIALLDVENFTGINDSFGRDTGDAVLRAVGERVSDRLTEPFTVARISADTFAVAQVAPRDRLAAALRDEVNEALAEPVRVRGRELRVAVQTGIALYPGDGTDAETLFKNAEAALKEAKSSAQRVLYYAAEMNASMATRLVLEEELRSAIERAQLALFYQPRIDLLSGQLVGAEALIRWQHPSGTLLGPGQFIPLAEQTGLIVPIGEWVVRTVCRQQATWLQRGVDAVPVSLNLSAVQFRRTDVLACVRAALVDAALDAKYLELELTETVAMEDPAQAEVTLRALRDLGVRISLDDFGTGFSSLAYLKRFPLSAIKIDRAFITDITHSPDDAAIANAVIAMAHGMGLRVVAEGVETEAQLNYLRGKHCDEMQGYAFSAPLTAEAFEQLLRGHRSMAVPSAAGDSAGTLLVVDDEAGIRSALNRALRRDGYRILTAASGKEGLDLLALNPVQVIISDQRMPGMSGAEFLDVVRQLYPETIRIILSGYTDIQVVTDGVNRGAVYKFLTKPWDDDLLREQVRDAFRRYRP